jgi:glutaminyl-tRNA synthetase
LLKTPFQVEEALTYLKNNEKLNVEDFERDSGVGVEVTEAQIKDKVASLVQEKLERLKVERYLISISEFTTAMKSDSYFKFADGKLVVK